MHTPEHPPKPLAAFDLDGTLFKSSMLEAIYEHLCEEGKMPQEYVEGIALLQRPWSHIRNSEGPYIAYVLKMVEAVMHVFHGSSPQEVIEFAQATFEKKEQRQRWFIQEAMRILRPTHEIVIISASLTDISRIALQCADVDIPPESVFGSTWELDENGLYTGKGVTLNKSTATQQLLADGAGSYKGSYGFGDTVGDLDMFRHLETGIMVHPSATMARAGSYKYHTVTGGKDNITHIFPDDGYSGRTEQALEAEQVFERIQAYNSGKY